MENKLTEKKWDKGSILAPSFLPLKYKVLINRGLESDEINDFISFDKLEFHNPFLFKDMEKAVELIKASIDKNENILIYGDYDVDGVTSSAILFHFFKALSTKVNVFIPDRVENGYGLSKEVLEDLVKDNDLFITVDCGITANEEVKFLKEAGKNVIITDHHQMSEELPNADAIINPHLEDDYPTKFLCGAGVSLKLAQGVSKKIKSQIDWDTLHELAAIGTIADIVPLQKENRLIVKLGLEAINNKNLSYGLEALIKVSGLKKGEISTGNVAFGIAPRINATGRLGSALDALKLLVTTNKEEATRLAESLNMQNEKRKAIEQKILAQAMQMIDINNNIHILYDKDWHHGVLGIVASKIVEKTYRPTILLGGNDDCIKGSGRSIKGIHLQKLLLEHDKYLLTHGGHELAAGLSLKEEDFSEFKKSMEDKVDKIFMENEFYPIVRVDLAESINNLSYEAAYEIDSLGPFGFGNPQPSVLLESVEVVDIQDISKGKHKKLVVKDFFDGLECLMWNTENVDFSIGDKVDIVGTLSKNEWMNIKSSSLTVKDLKINSKVKIIDKRDTSKEDLNDYKDALFVTYHKYLNLDNGVIYQDIFEPTFYRLDNNDFKLVNMSSIELFSEVVLYNTPFFANQLNKLPIKDNGKLILAYESAEIERINKILTSIEIDKPYLTSAYRRINDKDVLKLNFREIKISSFEERIKLHKFFNALKIFSELNLISFNILENNQVKIELIKGQKVNLEDSKEMLNYNKLLNRAKSESKFLINADKDQINKYVRRV